MPPKVTIKTEQIVAAAFQLMREGGLEAVSARNIAKTVGCSRQPIYSSFENMGALKRAAVDYAKSYTTQKYLLPSEDDPVFLSIGIGYVRFAVEEPSLFRVIYNSPGMQLDFDRGILPFDVGPLIAKMGTDPLLGDLPYETLLNLLKTMWIYTHGLATLLINVPESLSLRMVEEKLERLGEKLISWELSKFSQEIVDLEESPSDAEDRF